MEGVSGASGVRVVEISRKELFVLTKVHLQGDIQIIFSVIEELLSQKFRSPYQLTDHKKGALRNLIYIFRKKWLKASRTEERFYRQFDQWLNVSLTFDQMSNTELEEEARNSRGRPSLDFSVLSERSKRRKTEDIRSRLSTHELGYAKQMSLRSLGQSEAANIVNNVTLGTPSTPLEYRESMETRREETLSVEEALSVIVELQLSRSQYEGLRAVGIRHNCHLFPSYSAVLEAKRNSYPDPSAMTITECSAEVKLQALLDHTAKQILRTQQYEIEKVDKKDLENMTLICKWGCDGSSGHSIYKQKFMNDDGHKTDEHVFLTSLVPLQLISENEKKIIWKNPRPASPRFCRPIRLQFLQENTECTVQEIAHIKQQENQLIPLQLIIDEKEVSIFYELACTMIDGKVCNAATSTTSMQRCYLCNATSKDFNNIDDMLQKQINEDHLSFGLSTLHAWIRFFECCLHISYKLDIKKWQARSVAEKSSVDERKKLIQKGFRTELGLIVDRPKQTFGSSNDGNTARRFFENADISARITGIDLILIKRLYIIMQVISSGFEIDVEKFKKYAVQTAKLFVRLYPWYYMPTSMHKILIHGPRIISAALLPIGQMSEEAQEASNKYIRRFRQNFARKSFRIKNLEDVFCRLQLASDPYISSIRKLPRKKSKALSEDAIQLLSINMNLMTENVDTTNDNSDYSDVE